MLLGFVIVALVPSVFASGRSEGSTQTPTCIEMNDGVDIEPEQLLVSLPTLSSLSTVSGSGVAIEMNDNDDPAYPELDLIKPKKPEDTAADKPKERRPIINRIAKLETGAEAVHVPSTEPTEEPLASGKLKRRTCIKRRRNKPKEGHRRHAKRGLGRFSIRMDCVREWSKVNSDLEVLKNGSLFAGDTGEDFVIMNAELVKSDDRAYTVRSERGRKKKSMVRDNRPLQRGNVHHRFLRSH